MNRASTRAKKLLPLVPAVAAGGIAVALAWRRWIDPLADSGREFDIPMRVAGGERLLHEISSYFYGPLWPWLGGILIRVFGRHFATLEIAAGIIAVSAVVGLYLTVRRCAGEMAAGIAAALAAAFSLAAFSPAALMFPYSVCSSMALAAGFLALATIGRRRGGAIAAGFLTTMMLCRPEFGLALAGAAVLAGARASDKTMRRRFIVPALAAIFAAAAIYGFEFRGIPFSELLTRSPLVALVPLPVIRRFYLENAGLLDPARTFPTLAADLLVVSASLAALAAISSPRLLPRLSRAARLVAVAAGAVTIAATRIGIQGRGNGLETSVIFAAAPLVIALAAIVVLLRPIRTEHLIPFLLFAFATVEAFRVFFRIRLDWITTYSAIAFPPLVAAVAVLLLGPWKLPAVDRALFGRALAIAAAAVIAVHLSVLAYYRRTHWGGFLKTSAGTVWMRGDRTESFECLFDEIAREARPGDGLTAFPESGFFNFVTGLRSPLGEDMVTPGVLRSEAEEHLAARLETDGPRFVVLANRPTPEYDEKFFGIDYARPIFAAIGRRYVLARNCGAAAPDAPVGSPDFFLRLYERRPGSAPPAQ